MTSPALVVLFLAHVCSIFGTASAPAADHDNKETSMRTYNETHSSHNNLWTNLYKNLDESKRELFINKYKNTRISRDSSKYLDTHQMKPSLVSNKMRVFNESMIARKRRKREDTRCEFFRDNDNVILHPHYQGNSTYYRNINCVTIVTAPKDKVIELTFVDEFQIEYHPKCAYDYLEIRDGKKGYAKLLGQVCGTAFPPVIQTSGPYAWLKFHSDDTIEYSGFKILVAYLPGPGQSVPESCYITKGGRFGELNLETVSQKCRDESTTNLDVLWTIETPENTKIYLNFTSFKLAVPNECEQNVVEVFGEVAEMDHLINQYCGSIANPVSTKADGKENDNEKGNIMNVRIYVSQLHRKDTSIIAVYNSFRMVNPSKDEKCHEDEFDCDDNTCIDAELKCEGIAHCRLKTDEDPENCKHETASTISQPHIMVILIIFSLILSAMSFVFLFKCIRKLYQDHKIIKEHIRESCEDRLDEVGSRLTLDAQRLQRDSEPRASLERENRANELFKRKRESFSKRMPTSIDSDYIQETHLDLDEEPWRREVDSVPIEPDDVRIERNGRTRRSERARQDQRSERGSERQSEKRSEMSKKEESIRNKKETEEREKKEIRDVSVGPPDMKDSGCQTRESLFQSDAPPSSNGSGTTGTNSRGFSTFGYSGATIARPSPPTTNTSEITIELLRQVPKQDSVKPQKKSQDRRPISAETTRSAPDVIIVSKPIR